MSFQIVHNDITKMNTDVIVNAANSQLKMGGGVCGAIFNVAGAEALQKECNIKGPCAMGQAVITKGYDLNAKYVIHAVGPIWQGGGAEEEKYLREAYKNSLHLAKEKDCQSIAFPLISTGIYGYPKEEALKVAIATIKEFLLHNDMEVFLVVYDRKAVSLSEKLFDKIKHYIDTYYEEERGRDLYFNELVMKDEFNQVFHEADIEEKSINEDIKNNRHILRSENSELVKSSKVKRKERSLEELLNNIDETFSEMLLRIIDEKGYTDVEVYKRANMDRKLFSKIRSNREYNPKKQTVFALAIALKLSVDETIDLLQRAGYSFSNSRKLDIIIRYFIENKEYDIYKINEALFCFEQQLLGA